jgi:hypothetical protein
VVERKGGADKGVVGSAHSFRAQGAAVHGIQHSLDLWGQWVCRREVWLKGKRETKRSGWECPIFSRFRVLLGMASNTAWTCKE